MGRAAEASARAEGRELRLQRARRDPRRHARGLHDADAGAAALVPRARDAADVRAHRVDDPNAFWGVFMSAPQLVSDHQHFAASNFVFTRGADHLDRRPVALRRLRDLRDQRRHRGLDRAAGRLRQTQTPWSEAELLWARGTADATFAARSDFAKAFDLSDTPSDIPYAHREWVMLPEGEVVADRSRAHERAEPQHVRHAPHEHRRRRSDASNGVYSGTVGGSKVAIHAVLLSGGTPSVSVPAIFQRLLQSSCSYPCGQCDDARFTVDKYTVTVPGPWAVAVHVIDGLAASEPRPRSLSMNDRPSIREAEPRRHRRERPPERRSRATSSPRARPTALAGDDDLRRARRRSRRATSSSTRPRRRTARRA